MNTDNVPSVKDIEPYPFDDSLPGSEHSDMDMEDRRQEHRLIQHLVKEGEEVDGVLFRLLGWPDGKVRRAKLAKSASGLLVVVAMWRGSARYWPLTMCVVVTPEDSNEA